MASPLQQIPAEILCRIAWYCYADNLHTIGVLRRTCRDIYNKIQFEYANAYFNMIVVNVEADRLRTLMRVIQHDTFRLYVRKIHIHVERIVRDSVDQYEEYGDTGLHHPIMRFIEQGRFEMLFRQGVQLLPNLEDFEIGLPELAIVLPEDMPLFRRCWTKLLQSILSVIVAERILVKRFALIDYYKLCCPFSPAVLDEISRRPELLKGLDVLNLQLRIGSRSRAEPNSSSAPELIRILKAATRLTEFGLLLDHSEACESLLLELPRTLDILPMLRTLRLEHISAPIDVLVGFLRAYKRTVRDLRLEDFILTVGAWSDVFGFMLDEMTLQRLYLCNLCGLSHIMSFAKILAERPYAEEDVFWLRAPFPPPQQDDDDAGEIIADDSDHAESLDDSDNDHPNEENAHEHAHESPNSNNNDEEYDDDDEEEYDDESSERSLADYPSSLDSWDDHPHRLHLVSSGDFFRSLLEPFISYTYITRQEETNYIELEHGNGEDLPEWLRMVVDQHTMEPVGELPKTS